MQRNYEKLCFVKLFQHYNKDHWISNCPSLFSLLLLINVFQHYSKDHGIESHSVCLQNILSWWVWIPIFNSNFSSFLCLFTFRSIIFIIIAKVMGLNPIQHLIILNTHTNLAREPLGSLWYPGEELVNGCNDIWNIFINCTQVSHKD